MKNKVRVLSLIAYAAFIMVLLGSLGFLVYFKIKVNAAINDTQAETIPERHYAFICEDDSDQFYKAVYDAAKKEGAENGVYVEFFGKDLSEEYDKNERMEIAIAAKVDGIILEGDESIKTTNLINKADFKGIPVVTMGADNTGSDRKSYIGASFYNMGQLYGNEILSDFPLGEEAGDTEDTEKEIKQIMIFVNQNENDAYQNIIISGIQETINKAGRSDEFNIVTKAINGKLNFEAEETISEFISTTEKLPEAIVCLNQVNTTCVYQALIDHNRVGETFVYGYYLDDSILSAINRKIVAATAAIDAKKMGQYCVQALDEYISDGFVSEYMPVDIQFININNTGRFIVERAKNEEDQIRY
ncbi:MAG: substrate-binding domain-containing protein [Lachnospiraceae bacterium]|nr:substrate-binding domain-containing protein [Lachnospiraceae bacterium]